MSTFHSTAGILRGVLYMWDVPEGARTKRGASHYDSYRHFDSEQMSHGRLYKSRVVENVTVGFRLLDMFT